MTSIINFVSKHWGTMAAGLYAVLNAAVLAMPGPDEKSSRRYEYWYHFLHGLPFVTVSRKPTA
jgi:hypothetical protein